MTDNKKSLRNKLAASGGLIMGLALYGVILIDYFANLSAEASMVASVLNITIICSILFFFTRQYTLYFGKEGISYGTAYGFVILLMLFAGVIYGSFFYMQTNIVDPDYYYTIQSQVIDNNDILTSIEKAKAREMLATTMTNPIMVIGAAMISTLLYGAMLGLIVALFAIKRVKKEAFESDSESNSNSAKN